MRWVPILSFHQAGGNVNDDFMQTIPLWLWGKLLETHPELDSVRDLQYVSETGDASMEYVSLWADGYVLPYYQRFMSAFRDHFAARAGMIAEINPQLSYGEICRLLIEAEPAALAHANADTVVVAGGWR
mgnify:CR=1 FL=1